MSPASERATRRRATRASWRAALPLVAAVVLVLAPSLSGCGEEVLVGRLASNESPAGDEASSREDASSPLDAAPDTLPPLPPPDAAPSPFCEGKRCGDRCSTCTTPNCPAVVETCDERGQCLATQPACLAARYEPCAGVPCGATCMPCPPAAQTCTAPPVPHWCSSTGSCTTTAATCDGGAG